MGLLLHSCHHVALTMPLKGCFSWAKLCDIAFRPTATMTLE
jgi:hypothetical protein